MSHLNQLYTLQQVDSEIQQGKIRLGEILQAKKDPDNLASLRAKAIDIAKQSGGLDTQQKKLDFEVKAIRDEAEKAEKRLYSGNVKNPKELGDLQDKIKSLGRRQASVEDNLLEVLFQLEEVETDKASVDSDLHMLETEWKATFQSLQTEQKTLVAHLNQLIASRKLQATKISQTYLALYEKNRKKQRNGIAVAGLHNGQCQVCRVTQPAHIIKQVTEGKLTYCESCGRILNLV